MTFRVKGSLAWKLLGIGLLQLVLLAVVFVGVGWLVNGPPPEAGGGPSVEGPPPPLPPEYSQGVDPLRPPPRFSRPPRPPLVTPLNTLFFAGLVILSIGSVLTARSIVRPLRELSRAAKKLGEGDLHARSGLDRSDEIGGLGRAFDEMAERLERLVLAEKELLANVSHELRTPLTRIRVALDIRSEGAVGLPQPTLAEIGLDLAEIETMVDDILTTTRLEISRGHSAGEAHLELHEEPATAVGLCERAAMRFRSAHPERAFNVEIEPTSQAVRVDVVLFRRALDNLLENAHKYSPDPSTPIVLRGRPIGGAIVFEVEDRGMGISKEDLSQLFTPFFRADRSRTRGTGGVGLGLTLSKRIVEAHGGTIKVTSELGVGTTMRVTVPLAHA
jgi:two-component system, OmpR family, sensor kinase